MNPYLLACFLYIKLAADLDTVRLILIHPHLAQRVPIKMSSEEISTGHVSTQDSSGYLGLGHCNCIELGLMLKATWHHLNVGLFCTD